MAKFEIAEKITGASEGGYANNKADRGGQTINGIARKFWPDWPGWVKVDAIIRRVGENASRINAEVKKDLGLLKVISDFYKQKFWDANSLDKILDQQLANSVYDFGVNAGTRTAAKKLQEVLNLPADGIVGKNTLMAANTSNDHMLHTIYNCKRKEYYLSLIENDPSQIVFKNSWLSRLKPYV